MPARHVVQTAALTTALTFAALGARAAEAACTSYQCGGNSPIISGQPITNLDLTGAVHANVQLNPTLLSAPRCATDNGRVRTLTLGVDRGELTATEGASFLFGAGRPLNEPMHARGSFIMSSTLRLDEAAAAFRRGDMGHLDASF